MSYISPEDAAIYVDTYILESAVWENADAALSSVDMMIVDLFRIIFFLIFFGGLNDYYLLDLSASQVADEQVLLTQDMIGLKIYPLGAWSCFKKIIIR